MEITTREEHESAWRRDWSSFGTPQFAAFGLLAVAVLILGFWFMRWSTTPTWSMAASGLSAEEATNAGEELDAAGIENRLANGGSGIEVPTIAADEAQVVLGDSGVIGGVAEGYEILDRQGFTTSSFKQRIDYQRAMEGELAQSIMAMDAVTSATVHLAIPESTVFSEAEVLTRASVVVSGNPDQGTVASIVNVVASSIPGLDPSSVTIADTSGRILSGLADAGFANDQQLGIQELYESQLEMNAETMLSAALGPGRAVVRVSADLNFDETESESVTYSADGQVTASQQLVDEAFTGDAASASAGTLGQIDDIAGIDAISGDAGAYVRQEDATIFRVPSTRTVSRQAPGEIERITVAVLLDESLDPAPDAAALQPLIAAAVGIDEARGDSIVVETLAFDQTVADAAEALAAVPGEAGGGMTAMILGYLKTAVAVIGIILALLFLRKGIKPLLSGREDTGEPGTRSTPNALAAGARAPDDVTRLVPVVSVPDRAGVALGAAGTSLLEGGPSAASAVDMLQLIDQQPDAVADLLRGWMAEAN